jgi:PBP1b-binding outer membrane lipoprotein LpoB
MKTKIFFLLSLTMLLAACSKVEVIAPTPTVKEPTNQVVPTQSGDTLTIAAPENVEVTPKNVQGADVSGKAQDMPEWNKEWEHTSDPLQAPAAGEIAPNPLSN